MIYRRKISPSWFFVFCLPDIWKLERMAIADVVHAVAVEVHEAPALDILDPDPLGAPDHREARWGYRLLQEAARVLVEHGPGRGPGLGFGPFPAARRSVGFALGLCRVHVRRLGVEVSYGQWHARNSWSDHGQGRGARNAVRLPSLTSRAYGFVTVAILSRDYL